MNRARLLPLMRQFGPLIAAVLLQSSLMLLTVRATLDYNDGHLVYGLDDAYIHMAIAENFAQDGVWGVTPHEFTSSTSSPLWTFTLAVVYFFTGAQAITPLLLNWLFAWGALWAVDDALRRSDVPALIRLAVLIAVIVWLPLNTLVLAGMEHVLQIMLAVLFLSYGADRVARDDVHRRDKIRLAVLGALLGTVRYEGLFLVLILCVLLALRGLARREFSLRGRVAYSVILGAVSIAPVIVYGLIAIANGWDFLPTSLTLKSSSARYLQDADPGAYYDFFVLDTYRIFFADRHLMLAPVVAACAALIFRYHEARTVWNREVVILIALVAITFLSVRLVSWPEPGTFSRYEAYLLVLASVALTAALARYLPAPRLQAIPSYAAIGLLLLFLTRDVTVRYQHVAYDEPIITATRNIYWQQYTMGQFVRAYYDGEAVAANDIGAINYFPDIMNVDLYGLGTLDVARAKLENRYTTDEIRRITQAYGVRIAVVYTFWFEPYGGLPPEWILVGQWAAPNNVILGSHVVDFYAVNEAEAEMLAANLADFAPRVPDLVEQIVNWPPAPE
jgi:hypothetical protein